ncbi:MAG TPA: hypothetical protein VGP78_01510 [Solirubrobacteraceae bacterium]|nr:hypothetical protein [Solirubrobacteraceae bacterium]
MRPTLRAAAVVIAALVLGCGAASERPVSGTARATTAPSPAACRRSVVAGLAAVARRIHREAASGADIAEARRRVRRSSALLAAVSGGDAPAARRALQALREGQIARADVDARGRRLAAVGHGTGLAPATVRLRGPDGRAVGRVVLATTDVASFRRLVHRLTGARVATTARGTTSAGPAAVLRSRVLLAPGAAASPAERTFVLTFPAAAAQATGCATGSPRLVAAALVARRLAFEEGHGATVARVVARVERDAAFRRAVAADDPAATRAAIVALFRDHIHVVRVRVERAGRLLVDVGGPYVLSPARGVVRDGAGAVAGRFELALQDDSGFVKLVRRFTGARVSLGTAAGHVPVSPPLLADAGYPSASFTAAAFPAGALRVLLAFPAGSQSAG